MSAYSSITVSKSAAQKYLMARIFDSTEEELGYMLDGYLAERLYNATVIDSAAAPDDSILDD